MKLLLICLAMLSLSCGVASTTQITPKMSIDAPQIQEESTSDEAESTSVVMIVTADELNVRVCPGINCMALEKSLSAGDIVTCDKFSAPMAGDGLWCHHEAGWSNARYMEVVK